MKICHKIFYQWLTVRCIMYAYITIRSCKQLSTGKNGSIAVPAAHRQLTRPKRLTFVCNTSSSNCSGESRSAGSGEGHPGKGEVKTRRIQSLQPQRSRWHREIRLPTRRRCRDTCESCKHRDPFRNPPFSQCMWINFMVIYFRGCPRPQKYFNMKIYQTKISEHKNFLNYRMLTIG